MDPYLVTLTAAALTGIASKPNGGHGVEPKTAEEIGREAVGLARATLAALEETATEPTKPTVKRAR